jgi:hypothetical protein
MTPFNHTSWLVIGTALCVGGLLPTAGGARDQAGCVTESFTGAAVGRADANVGAGMRVDIHVAAWTVERDKDRLVRVLAERGAAAFVHALEDTGLSLGEVPVGGGRPSPLRFAWQERLDDGGRRLLLITDRPPSV